MPLFRKIIIAVVLTSILTSAAFAENADSPAVSPEAAPLTYKMQLIYIPEGDRTEFIFTVGQSGFKSVEALKRFIATLPKGSVIEFQSTCRRIGGEPLISSEPEIEEFKAFCGSHGVTFKYIPSG